MDYDYNANLANAPTEFRERLRTMAPELIDVLLASEARRVFSGIAGIDTSGSGKYEDAWHLDWDDLDRHYGSQELYDFDLIEPDSDGPFPFKLNARGEAMLADLQAS